MTSIRHPRSGLRAVVKVGGSLFDLPHLADHLRQWLSHQNFGEVYLVPGGGSTADVVRRLDHQQGLGEEQAHWLALQALTLNANFFARLLPEFKVSPCYHANNEQNSLWIVDAFTFCRSDEGNERALPHRWTATSDSVALRVAQVVSAQELILLKSVSWDVSGSWNKAAQASVVDAWFPEQFARGEVPVRVVNFRQQSSSPEPELLQG